MRENDRKKRWERGENFRREMNSGTRGKTIGGGEGKYRKSDHRAGKSLSGVPDLRSERRKREIIPTDFSAPERTGGRAHHRLC